MTKSKERTFQAMTVTPPSLKPVRRSQTNLTARDEKTATHQVELEEIEQKQDIIIRLIDYIKSI
jgi:hypothetical protein